MGIRHRTVGKRVAWAAGFALVLCVGLRAELYSTFGDGYSFREDIFWAFGHGDDVLPLFGVNSGGYAVPFVVDDEDPLTSTVPLESVTVAIADMGDDGLNPPPLGSSIEDFGDLSFYIGTDSDSDDIPDTTFLSLEPFPPEASEDDVEWIKYQHLLYADTTEAAKELDEGTTYWLVAEPTNFATENYYKWYVGDPFVTGDYLWHVGDNGLTTWIPVSGLQVPAFEINGPSPIPEPVSGVLIGLLGGVGLLRRRRRC